MAEKEKEKVPRDNWPKFFDSIAKVNEGRKINISRLGEDRPELEKDLPLLAMVYDTKKGSVFITTGDEAIKYEHPVDGPREVWVDQDSQGRAKSIDIVDMEGNETLVMFESD